jgi:RNA polymerase sigma-70 factor, ECF subfamily
MVEALHKHDLSDEEVALRVVRGETFLFGHLIDRYAAPLSRYGRRFLADRDDIDDVVQEVFVKTYEHLASFDTARSFKPWIYRIAHNVFVNALRRREKVGLSLDWDTLAALPLRDESVESEEERKNIRDLLERGMDKLSVKYREVLVLYYTEELSYKEISEILHLPLGTVCVRVKRAREALRGHIEHHL